MTPEAAASCLFHTGSQDDLRLNEVCPWSYLPLLLSIALRSSKVHLLWLSQKWMLSVVLYHHPLFGGE